MINTGSRGSRAYHQVPEIDRLMISAIGQYWKNKSLPGPSLRYPRTSKHLHKERHTAHQLSSFAIQSPSSPINGIGSERRMRRGKDAHLATASQHRFERRQHQVQLEVPPSIPPFQPSYPRSPCLSVSSSSYPHSRLDPQSTIGKDSQKLGAKGEQIDRDMEKRTDHS